MAMTSMEGQRAVDQLVKRLPRSCFATAVNYV